MLSIKSKSFRSCPNPGARRDHRGTIVAGSSGGGWGLFMHEGAARFAYSLFGINVFVTDAEKPLPAASTRSARSSRTRARIREGRGRHALLRRRAGWRRERGGSQPMLFSATEGLRDRPRAGDDGLPGATVESTVFNGEIDWVELTIGDDDHTHLIDRTTCSSSCRSSRRGGTMSDTTDVMIAGYLTKDEGDPRTGASRLRSKDRQRRLHRPRSPGTRPVETDRSAWPKGGARSRRWPGWSSALRRRPLLTGDCDPGRPRGRGRRGCDSGR